MQADRRRSWGYFLFLILAPLVPLWKAVFLGQAIGPFDQIRQMAPWNGPKPDQPWDVLPVDGVLQFYTWRDLVLDSWHRHVLPFWNPYELAGTPLMANSQSAPFYPLHILFGIVGLPTALAMTLLAWFHLALAGLGVRRLSVALGASELGAVIGGVSFSLSAFMVAWTMLPSVITTVAWIPWALAFVAEYQAGQRRKLAGAAASLGMMFLAGHLQFAAYGVMAVILLAAGLALARREWRIAAVGILALGLGGMLGAIQILPALNYSQFSHRRNSPTSEGYQAYVGSAIKPFELSTLGMATVNGNPRAWANDDPTTGVSSYWPAFVKQGANFAESAIALGPLVLVLLALAPWRKRETYAVAGVGVVALLLAMGTPLNMLLYFGVPGWSSTGSPGRIVVLFVMVACVLAALGLTNLSDRTTATKKPNSKEAITAFLKANTAPIAVLVIGLLFCRVVAGVLTPFPEGTVGESIRAIAGTTVGIQSLLGFTFGLVVLAVLHFSRGSGAAKLLPLPLLVALSAGTLTLVSTGAPLAPVKATEGVRIAVINDGWGLTAAAPALLPPDTATQSRIPEIGGYDSLIHRDTVAMLNDINGRDSAPPANGNMMFIKPGFDLTKLREAGVQEVWSTEALPYSSMPSVEDENGVFRTTIGGPGVVSALGGTVKVLREDLGQLDLQVEGASHLTVRQRAMPGWTISVDGKSEDVPVGKWIEHDLSGGNHAVELRYTPPGFRNGMLLSLFAVLAVLGLALVRTPQAVAPKG